MKKRWLIGSFATAGALYLLRRWGTRWGTTPAEFHQVLPGDEIVPHTDLSTTHAISIRAFAGEIWPWLVQLGYYRGGWHTDSSWRDWDYYPDRILRFFVREEAGKSGYGHRDTPTQDEVLPEFQQLKAGDVVLDGPPGTAFFTVAAIEPEEFMVLHSNTHLRFLFPKAIRENPRLGIGGEFTWAFYLQEAGESHTRLILRTRGTVQPWWYRLAVSIAIPVVDLFMARKMLRGIKQSVESSKKLCVLSVSARENFSPDDFYEAVAVLLLDPRNIRARMESQATSRTAIATILSMATVWLK